MEVLVIWQWRLKKIVTEEVWSISRSILFLARQNTRLHGFEIVWLFIIIFIDFIEFYWSIIDAGSSLTSRSDHITIDFRTKLEIESVFPVDGIRFINKPEVWVEYGEYKGSSFESKSGLLIVDLIMKVVHVVRIFFGIIFMRGVDDEPFTYLEHGSESIEICFEGKFKVLNADDGSLSVLFDFSELP